MVFRPGRRRHGGTARPGAGYRLMLTRQALIQIAEVYFGQVNFDYACFDADRSTKPGHVSDLCVPKTSSMSCDQAGFVDEAAGVSLSLVPITLDIYWFGFGYRGHGCVLGV